MEGTTGRGPKASLQLYVPELRLRGLMVITNGWQAYCGLNQRDMSTTSKLTDIPARRAADSAEFLSKVHLIVSLVRRKRWCTHQGIVIRAQFSSYVKYYESGINYCQ